MRSLKQLNDSDFTGTANIYPQPYANYPTLDSSVLSPFNLPSVLVPPEVIELDGIPTESEEDAQVKKDEWPEYLLRLFDNDVCAIILVINYNLNLKFDISLVDFSRSYYTRWLCYTLSPHRYYRCV